jgi:hypothetical protein
MERSAPDGKQPSWRNPPRWSGRAIKNEGIAFVFVGVVSAIVIEFLSVSHTIALTTRDTEFRGSVSFALVGLVTFFIGWRKSRRTGS